MPISLLNPSDSFVAPMNSAAARLTSLTAPSRVSARNDAQTSQTFHLEIVSDEDEFLALEPVWDELLSRSAIRTPFMTWDWVSLWWEEGRGNFQLTIGVVRDASGTALAIAPLMIGHPVAGARRHLRHLTFLGGIGDITSEGLDFIVPRGMEASLTPLLCQVFMRLRSQWETTFLPMIDEASPNLPHILDALRRFGSGTQIVDRYRSHFISLPNSWDDIEMSHGQNWRSNHRRKWKKMLSQHTGRPLQGSTHLTPSESLDVLIRLHSRRWCVSESNFLRENVLNFHRKLVQRWLPADRLSINILELDGAPGAATYCFHHDGRSWFYQAGWNADYSDLSIGKMAIAWAVQCAIQRGLREFDFLPGDLPYKQEWSDARRSVVDIETFNRLSPRAAVFKLLRYCKRKTTRTVSTDTAIKPDDEPRG